MTVKELREKLDKLPSEYDDYIITRPKPQWKPGPGFGYDEHYKGDIYEGEVDRPVKSATLYTWKESFNID